MKFNYLAMLGTVAFLTVSCAQKTPSNSTPIQEQSSSKPATEQVTQETTTSGTFVAADHPTQGMVSVVTENGQRYLEFDQAFTTDSGPDLFVLLHRSESPQSYQQQDYINLGKLKQINGTQRYTIPNDVNLADYRSTVIWCRQFNVTFGYATLGS